MTDAERDTKRIEKYGPIHGRVIFGGRPVLALQKPELIREVLVKHFASFMNRGEPPSGGESSITSESLLGLRDQRWKEVRSKITPSFSSAKMRRMDALIRECLKTLVSDVDKRIGDSIAESGGGVAQVEAKSYFSNFAMDVIASSFFGINIDVQRNRDHPFVKHSTKVFAPITTLQLFVFRKCRKNGGKSAEKQGVDESAAFIQLLTIATVFLAPLRKYLLKFGFVGMTVDTRQYFEKTIADIMTMRRRGDTDDQGRHDFLHLMLHASNERAATDTSGFDELAATGDLVEQAPAAHDSSAEKAGRTKTGAPMLSDAEIAAQCFIFMTAGFETTSATIGFLFYHLALNPKMQDRLREELQAALGDDTGQELSYDSVAQMPYLDALICETLRLYPPAVNLARYSSEEVVLSNGIRIPKGVMVRISTWALHRDAKYWKNPTQFDPERFLGERKQRIIPYTWMPFGEGPRNCVGMRFALLEIKMLAAQVMRSYRVVTTAKTEIPLQLAPQGLTNAKNGVHIGFKKLD